MAIREVQEIPTGHKRTKKDIIWDDIQEAISKGITKFERKWIQHYNSF